MPEEVKQTTSGTKVNQDYIQLKTYIEEIDGKKYYGLFVTDNIIAEIKKAVRMDMAWKESVENFQAISTTYPKPAEGWVVAVKDTNNIYRYDEATQSWINILSNATANIVTTTTDGLMPAALYASIKDGIQADSVIETNSRKFVTQEQLTKINELKTFDGYAGEGSYFGIKNKAARSDHDHENLLNLKQIKVENQIHVGTITNADLTSLQNASYLNLLTFYKSVDGDLVFNNQYKNSATSQVNKSAQLSYDISGNLWTSFNSNKYRFLTTNDNFELSKITDISATWKDKLRAPYKNIDWESLENKPQTFAPSAHTHLISEITDVNSVWQNMLKVVPAFPYANLTGTPSTFEPVKHTHSYLHVVEGNQNNDKTELSNLVSRCELRTGFNNDQSSFGFGFNAGTKNQTMPSVDFYFVKNKKNPHIYHNTLGHDDIALLNTAQTWTGYQDFTSGAGNTGSDMRFKKNVENVNPVLNEIKKLDIISYDWIKEGEERSTFGVNANQLLELGGIFESMVHERLDEDKTKWVEYDRFGVIALKAIQELSNIIYAQNSTICELKKTVNELEHRIKNIPNRPNY